MTSGITPISLTIEAPVAPAVAWTYLTDPERIAEWFTDATPLGAVGDRYRLDFGGGSIAEGQVLEVGPGRAFAHGWAWTDAEPRQATRVRWQVDPLPGGGSRIALVHDGWSEVGADKAIRDDHEAAWSGYLDDLRGLLEGSAAS